MERTLRDICFELPDVVLKFGVKIGNNNWISFSDMSKFDNFTSVIVHTDYQTEAILFCDTYFPGRFTWIWNRIIFLHAEDSTFFTLMFSTKLNHD